MMTRRMQRMMQQKQGAQQEGAPRQAMLMGEPHMLAYINEAERQMLKRAGGAEAPGPAGIPAYWKLFEPSTWGDGKGFEGFTSSSSGSNSNSDLQQAINDTVASVVNESNNNNTASAYQQLGQSLNEAGVANIGGKTYPDEPANPGNPAILQYNPGNDDDGPSYQVVGALDPTKPASVATNADGSIYQPTNNPVNIANTLATADLINTGYDGNMILPDGNGGYVTVDGNQFTAGGNWDATGGNTTGGGTGGGGTSTTSTGGNDNTTTVVTAPPVNQALLDAQARRAAALAEQMGAVATAFGFSTDDYYNQLGTDYREGGLSEAFTTAYDDAVRGIYDVYKSAGMLTQSDVDDDLGILAGANSGEEGRMDSIVDQYTTANRNYVTEGRGGIEGELQGFVTDTEDIPTIDAQTAQILAYDVPGKSQPYKTPQEAEVVEFFSDFVKRAYDPSYNVDPTALASGGPKKVSGSVDQLGAGTQPSTIAGILDPVKGGSVKVVG